MSKDSWGHTLGLLLINCLILRTVSPLSQREQDQPRGKGQMKPSGNMSQRLASKLSAAEIPTPGADISHMDQG